MFSGPDLCDSTLATAIFQVECGCPTDLPEAGGSVGARAMDEQWVEEDSVSNLHLQMLPWH